MNTRNPIVQVYDSSYKQIIPNDIIGTSVNTAEIRFDYATTGYVVMSNGGGLYVTGSTSMLTQTSAATTWSFTHNLNSKYVNFEVYDSNDFVVIPANIKVVDTNNANLYFATPTTGTAIAMFSGINGAPNATTASYALTASFVNPLNQKVIITGSLIQGLAGNIASGDGSHAEGYGTRALGPYSHAEGILTSALGNVSHTEGNETTASADYSHAEGSNTTTLGYSSHAEGYFTLASGSYSHAEGYNTVASGSTSHAEGDSTQAIGIVSHAEGAGTIASGTGSHAEGYFTLASGDYQHVQGQYNISSSAQSAFIIGNGASTGTRSNLVFASGSQFQITGSLNVSGSVTTTTGYVILTQVSASLNFVDDASAAAGGVPLGGLYRNGNFILIRIS